MGLSPAFVKRVENLRRELHRLSLRGALICDPENLYYFSGHLIQEGNATALLVIPTDGEAALVVHEDDHQLQSIQDFTGDVLTYRGGVSLHEIDAASTCFIDVYGKSLHPLGIESYSLPFGCGAIVGFVSDEAWRDIQGIMARLRRCKDDDEIALIRHAAAVADTGQEAARELFAEGLSEIVLLSECRSAMEEAAGAPIGFLADVLVGEKTALIGSPLGVAGSYCAEAGDPAIVDLLPRVQGYFADTTRTLWSGTPPAEVHKTVALLQEVKRDLEKLLKPGARAAEIDAAARGRLDREGLFPHHTGHGIGISHFEAPFIRQGSEDVLEAGNVITLEPGLYFDGWGARVEDDYLITPEGFEKLTRSEGG
jgi:Xaa-Pro aminopeptidase